MINTHTLLLFIQSDNPGLYANIITHCVRQERVRDIYFAVNEGEIGKLSEAKDKIKKIIEKIDNLVKKYQAKYDKPSEVIPFLSEIEKRIIRVSFTKPSSSIEEIKREFKDIDRLMVDVSGCNKKVAMDIIASYIPNGIKHICCFELDDIVYSPEWKNKGLTMDYPDICNDINYYEYIDFSKEGATIESFNNMRSKGNIVRILFAISIILVITVCILVKQQKNDFALYATLMLSLITGFGFVNSIFGFVERFK